MTQSDEFSVKPSDRGTRNALDDFQTAIAEHVAAIQKAARDRLASMDSNNENAPSTFRIEIGVGRDPKAESAVNRSVDCYDEDYICGKSASGYIHCTAHVCMIVGPVTVEP